MGSAGMCIGILVLQAMLSTSEANKPQTIQDAIQLADENAAQGVVDQDGVAGNVAAAAGVVVNNGEINRDDGGGSGDIHQGGFEEVIQKLQKEVYEADELPAGDVLQQILNVGIAVNATHTEGDITVQHTSLELPATGGSSHKRQVVSRDSRWTNAIIPYSFTHTMDGENVETEEGIENTKRAFKFFEMTTCLKFPQWTSTLNTELNRTVPYFLRFIKPVTGGCWSFVGMGAGYRTDNGQAISVCSQYGVAVHEIGHAIGFAHEQNRGDRYLHVKLYPENADAKHKGTFNGAPDTSLELVHPYDYGSIMHYGRYGFSGTGLPTLSALDEENNFLIGNKDDVMSHYDIMGVTKYYDCTDPCPADKKSLKCQNDGFVDFKCKCRCPPIFTGDLCEKLYKPATGPTDWPAGSYGLGQPLTGCPSSGWEEGSRSHPMEGSSHTSGGGLIDGVSGSLTTDYFCMRSSSASSTTEWPKGSYCIYQGGDTCPSGFSSGYLFFDDKNDGTGSTFNGSLPKGTYNEDTTYYYCCRSDAPPSERVSLPKTKPFVLPRYMGTCQAVEGMGVKGFEIHYDLENTNTKYDQKKPYVSKASWFGNHWLYYCYYYPLNYECGGEITLTTGSPSQVIQTPNYPSNYDNARECIWYIRGPEHRSMAIDFDDFDVEATSGGSCKDSVEVRHTLVAQPGERYCGKNMKSSFISDDAFLMIIFRSDNANQRKGFNATVRMITDEEQCYDPRDKGVTYRGVVDYTKHYHHCIPWEKAKHCDVDAFDSKYLWSGLVGHNHCRNPNGQLRPWCYVNEFCEIDPCDVCNFGKCYDFFDDCAELVGKDPDYCDTEEAFHGCHKTCKKCGAELNNTIKNCKAPSLKDKNAYIAKPDDTKTTFAFGDKITLKCKNVPNADKMSSELTCTTDGLFTGEQVFCGEECETGWTSHMDRCYKRHMEKKVHYAEAVSTCKADNATLVSIRNSADNDYLKTLAGGNTVWIGLNDVDKDDKWTWEDGWVGTYTNWNPGEPTGGSERCTELQKSGKWNDLYCEQHYPQYFICDKGRTYTDEDYYCADENENCFDIIERNYKLCKDKTDYAEVNCRKSCALCPAQECAHPGVGENAAAQQTSNYIDAGQYFEYKCNAGYELASGHLGRTCLREGLITGKTPKCLPEAQFEDRYGFRPIARSEKEAVNKITVYNATDALIGRDGQVLRWEVYSRTRSVLVAQIWRKTDDVNKFILISQTWLNLRPKRRNVYKLKSFERDMVKTGDMIGWYTPFGTPGLTYSDCGDEYSTSRIVHQADMKEMSTVKDGMELTLPVIDKCRTYSIDVIIGQGSEAQDINIAALKYGGRCLDASSNKDICHQALDGDLAPFDGSWVSDNGGVGSYIKIGFNAAYNVVGGRFMQRQAKSGQMKRVTLTFSDKSTQTVGLNERQGTSYTDISAMEWDSFDLQPVVTTEVTVTVASLYSQDNNGFIEIEFYASCIDKWRPYGQYCYLIDKVNRKYEDAEANCAKTSNAHLASVADEKENAFLTAWAKSESLGDLFIGKNDIASEGNFVWTDGSTSGYTNWKSGEPDSNDCTWIRVSSGQWMVVHCTAYPRASACKRKIDMPQTLPYSVHGNEVKPRGRYDGTNEIGDVVVVETDSLKVTKTGSVRGWKLYARTASLITMIVVRPVTGQEMTYTVVGQNTLTTIAGRTSIITIPEFARINVQAGDYIAWSYVPTDQPPIPYDSCSSSDVNMKVIFYDRSSSSSLVDGDQFTGRLQTWYRCRVYSVGYIMTEVEVNEVNVASSKKLATCSGASSSDSTCGLVIDGIQRPWDSAWIPGNTALGSWISIKFISAYPILGARIMQNFNKAAQIKGLQLDFLNGKTQEVQLINRQGSSDTDYKVQIWDRFSIDPIVTASGVKMTVTSTYTDGNVGIIEVEFYSKGCPQGWTRFRTNCYKLYTTTKFYAEAETDCVAEGAHVSSVQDLAENNQLLQMSGGGIYVGYTLHDKTTWVASDASNFSYTNWDSNSPNGASNSEYCIAMGTDGLWWDQYCQWHYAKKYICKKSIIGDVSLATTTHGNPVQPRAHSDGSGSTGELHIERTDSMKVPFDASLVAYKMYTKRSEQLTLMVMRPVSGSEDQYTIVGENTVTTPNGKVDIITIPEVFRINVKAGDYVGFYYLKGSENILPWDSCSMSTKPTKRHYLDHFSSPWTIGLELKMTLSTYYACRTYSLGFLLNKKATPVYDNMARGAPCQSSTSASTCSLALDGGLFASSTAWISQGEHVGAWILITLPDTYPLLGGRIQQRLASVSRATEIQVEVDDGSTQKAQFDARYQVGTSQTDYKAQAWDTFTLTTVNTKTVKITVTASNSTEEVGFIEVELLSLGCPTGWTRFKSNCYKLYTTVKFYALGEADCVAEGAHISSVKDQDENDHLVKMAGGDDIYVGYTLHDKTTWVASDGSAFSYTNWKAGSPDGASNSEYCIAMGSDGRWWDQYCQWYYAKKYICKKAVVTLGDPSVGTYGNRVQPSTKTDSDSGYSYIERADTMKIPHDGVIQAWKVYSNKPADVTMMVMRPGTTDTEYTIVGENVIRLPDNRLNIINVQEIFQISVKAGDYIGWYYVPGSDGTIPWTSCDQSVKPSKYQYIKHVNDPAQWYVGTKLTYTTGTWHSCKSYSIAYVLKKGASVSYYNSAKGSTCSASSASSTCSQALDGGLYAFDSGWVSEGQGVGAWFKVTLPGEFKVRGGRVQQRYASTSRITEMECLFKDGSKQKITFNARIGTSQTDYTAQAWDQFTFDPVPTTNQVTATVTAVGGTDEVGLVELELLTSGCAVGWNKREDSCYWFSDDVKKTAKDAEEDCVSKGGHLSTVRNAEESSYLLTLGKGDIYVGIMKINGAFAGIDGSSLTFTNWKTNEPSGNGNCVFQYDNGKWDDRSCTSGTAPYICKNSILSSSSVTYLGERAGPRSKSTGQYKIFIPNKAENRLTKDATITGWKVYGKADTTAVMQVWRPVASTNPPQFTLVGSNVIPTKEGRTTVTMVPGFSQIHGKAGDVLGLQVVGGGSAVAWDYCDSSKVTMTMHQLNSGFAFPQRGQTMEVPTINSCENYSVKAILGPVKAVESVTNIAAISSITTCEASVNGESCNKVIDGDLTAPNGEWKTTGTVTGSWIKLNFNEEYKVKYVSVAQRFGAAGQSKDIKLEFSDSTDTQVRLLPRGAGGFTEARNGYWDDFELSQEVVTSFIKFTVNSTYTESENGFIELRVWASCAKGWTRFGNSCYFLSSEKTHFNTAKTKCTELGAVVTSVDSAEENAFQMALAKSRGVGVYRIGFLDNKKKKPDQVWGWQDGGDVTYTNWHAGKPSNNDTWGYCAYSGNWADGSWYDAYCEWFNEVPYLCQKDAPKQTASSRREVESMVEKRDVSSTTPPPNEASTPAGRKEGEYPPSPSPIEKRDVTPSPPPTDPSTPAGEYPPVDVDKRADVSPPPNDPGPPEDKRSGRLLRLLSRMNGDRD